MKAISLLQIQDEAKILQVEQNITYNQALNRIAQNNGFKAYQALLDKIKKNYIDDEDEQIKEFKSNVFENRKHIKSNFIKIEKLAEKYEEIQFDEKYDNEEETRKEMLEEIEEKAVTLSHSIVMMFYCDDDVMNKLLDNQRLHVEGCAYAGYTTSDYRTIYSDTDAKNADYLVELNIENQSFSFYHRDFNIEIEEYEENRFERKEWNEWNEIPDIELPI